MSKYLSSNKSIIALITALIFSLLIYFNNESEIIRILQSNWTDLKIYITNPKSQLEDFIGNRERLNQIKLEEIKFKLNYKQQEPYIKYLVLNTNNISKDRKVLKSFGIDYKKAPAIYLFNEVNRNLNKFLLYKNRLENQCDMLERLLIFIANGDCGLLSYLNFLHDPYYGMRFEYNSEKKKWRANLTQGRTPIVAGIGMCSLIDIGKVPEHYKCKTLQL